MVALPDRGILPIIPGLSSRKLSRPFLLSCYGLRFNGIFSRRNRCLPAKITEGLHLFRLLFTLRDKTGLEFPLTFYLEDREIDPSDDRLGHTDQGPIQRNVQHQEPPRALVEIFLCRRNLRSNSHCGLARVSCSRQRR